MARRRASATSRFDGGERPRLYLIYHNIAVVKLEPPPPHFFSFFSFLE